MLSAKEIEIISKQIQDGETPEAVLALLHAYMEKNAQSPGPASEQSGAHYMWELFKDAPKAVVRVNAENTILDVNDAFATLCKSSKSELAGRNFYSVIDIREELQDTVELQQAGAGAGYGEFSMNCTRSDGKTLSFRVERFPDPVRGEFYLVFSDVTDQRRFSETLAQDSVRGEIFVDIVNALWQDFMNYEKTLDVLTNKVSQHIGGSCIVHLMMDETDIIEHVAINHSNPKAMALFQDLLYTTKWHASEGLPMEVTSAGNALLVPAVTKANLSMLGCDAFAECLAALDTHSLLMMPMYHDGRIIGTMTLLRTGTSGPYTNRDKSFVQRIANVGAMAIINAQRMRRLNAELLTKLRTARSEMRHLHVLEAGFEALGVVANDAEAIGLPHILRLFGEALEAESAFIAVRKKSAGMYSIGAEWTNGNFRPALQSKFDGDIFIPRIWAAPLESGAVLLRTLDSFTETEKEFLKDADLLSIAILPMIESGVLRGILVFENCRSEEECLEKNESVMKTFLRIAQPKLLAAAVSDKNERKDEQ